MWEDPIVAEVHRTREKQAAECHFDIGLYFAGLFARQATLGARLVHQRQASQSPAAILADNSNSPAIQQREPLPVVLER